MTGQLTTICKKCVSTDAELTYLGKKADLIESSSMGLKKLIVIDTGGNIDAIFCKCNRCGYSWTQTPLDKHQGKEPPKTEE